MESEIKMLEIECEHECRSQLEGLQTKQREQNNLF